MSDQTLVRTGILGALIVAVCCATPVLVIALGAIGLSALTGHLDYVLLPALAFFIGLIGYGFYRQRRSQTAVANKSTNRT